MKKRASDTFVNEADHFWQLQGQKQNLTIMIEDEKRYTELQTVKEKKRKRERLKCAIMNIRIGKWSKILCSFLIGLYLPRRQCDTEIIIALISRIKETINDHFMIH